MGTLPDRVDVWLPMSAAALFRPNERWVRDEVTVATGAVGAVSATADDPCGYKVAGYHIDSRSWLCVTSSGFAVTAPGGAVSQRVPFPDSIDGIGVEGNINGWVLFRPK